MNYCPSCQASVAPYDRFCQICGAQLAPAPAYYPYYPPVMPRHEDHKELIIVVVAVLVILALALPAILYVMVSGLITPPDGTPRALGIAITQSSDGSTWIMTFTSVPTGVSQNSTSLMLTSASGATVLPPTTMYQLEGKGMNGVTYSPVTMGPMDTTCVAGDRILVATGQYPAGSGYQITSTGSILAAGTLQ